MTYIDFHTHRVPSAPDVASVVDGRDTWGIHPWRAGETFVFPDLSDMLAIGECGFDGMRGPSMERQEEVFQQHVRQSEENGKPLIVHCVRALDILLRQRREQHPTMPWMLHGFRGKPQQLRSLLAAGFYVGFGFHYNEESLRLCPTNRLMLETDDEYSPIAFLYNNVSEVRGIDVSSLCVAMAENYRTFFGKEPLHT